jgi:chitinase
MLKLLLTVLPLLLQAVAAAPGVPLGERAACEPVKAVTVFVHTTASESRQTGLAGALPVNAGLFASAKKDTKTSTAQSSSTLDPVSNGRDLYPTPPGSRITKGSDTPSSSKSLAGHRNVVYFPNWSIYGAEFKPQNLPADQITHLLYAFADIKSDGEVVSSDPQSDIYKRFETDKESPTEHNAFGCVKQVYLLKKKNRRMKTLLSIGGWTYSKQGKFQNAAKSEESRKRFASSAVKLLADWGMDGVDIDWEYPTTDEETKQFVLLLKETRAALDKYAQDNKQKYHYLLTIAVSADPKTFGIQRLEEMDPLLDAWHLMAYDYAGSWDKTSGNQANIFPDPDNMAATKFNTEEAVQGYTARGIPPSKIVLGLPLYGRSFLQTSGLGAPFTSTGAGSVEKGIWLYRDLPRSGAKVYFDAAVGATHSYDAATEELVSFDDERSARRKATYVLERGLGGAVFWEASGDKAGAESLVRMVAGDMGQLDGSENYLDYPQSQYDNIRKSMPS